MVALVLQDLDNLTERTMNSALYSKIVKEILWSWVCALKLEHTWVTQENNDMSHTSKSTFECLE